MESTKPTPTPRARSSPTTTPKSRRCSWDSPLCDPPGAVKGIVTEEMIQAESRRLDALGIDRPIKDELELKEFEPKDVEIEADITSEDESELQNVRRPKRGEGWWGHGPTMLPLRKSIPKPFSDGAGHCSQAGGQLRDADYRTTR